MSENKISKFKRVATVSMAALLTQASLGLPLAFALTEGQTASGETSLVVHLAAGGEYGGTSATGDLANPDNNNDGLGDNLAFTVPTRIDFVALADGNLVGPDSALAYIENESRYGVHVSSMLVSAKGPWSFVDDAMASSEKNVVDLNVGPASDPLSAASYLTKSSVGAKKSWAMSPAAATGNADRVELALSGHLNNVDLNIADETAFGQINWFVTPGTPS